MFEVDAASERAACERPMQSIFGYAQNPAADHIVVRMCWSQNERHGEVIIPEGILGQMQQGGYPAIGPGTLGIEFALGYAVTIGLLARLPVSLAGDQTVWDPRWGDLQMCN